jgi:hypothetical protein
MSEQMRKDFEEFAKSKGWNIDHNGQHYNHSYAYYAWQGWQASRQALVVELSKLPEASYSIAGTCYMSDVESALDKAGVSYR